MGLSSTEVAVETADIALAGNHLPNVAAIIDLGRQTLHTVRQNYTVAIGRNTLGVLAGTFGTLNPMVAAVLHNASSVAVVLNSARLVGYHPDHRSALRQSSPPEPTGHSDDAAALRADIRRRHTGVTARRR